MSKDREYVFLSLMIPAELANDVKQNSSNNMADAANALEHNLMQGLAENLSVPPKIINVLPIGSYPQYYSELFVKKSKFKLCNRDNHENIGFCNIKFARNYFIEKAVYDSLEAYCKKKSGNIVICIYSASLCFLSAVEKLKNKFPNIIVCDIIADLPGMTNLSSNKSVLLQWYIDYQAKNALNKLNCVDCFVLLTKQMASYLHINKPYCVVEGIASETQELRLKEHNEKIILYTGTLHKKFGVMNLVSAFCKINNNEYRLVICGIGDSENEIKKFAESDHRISFLGQLPRDEVLRLQSKATVLVNPRQNNEEFTKYSFPSKTMEYLSSGIPVIAYKLDGIPAEYDQYLQYVEDDTIDGLKNKLVELCEMPYEQRQKIGGAGRNFVLKEKNSRVQTKNIIELINEVYEYKYKR